MNIEELKSYCNDCLDKLESNTEWKNRYSNYPKRVERGEKTEQMLSTGVRFNKPFSRYSSISISGDLDYDIRMCGQSVAHLCFDSTKECWCLKVADEKKAQNNYKYFGLKYLEQNPDSEDDVAILKKTLNVPWRSPEADLFRSVLTEIYNTTPELCNGFKSYEHLLENVLLKEFDKSSAKLLPNIKPVKIKRAFFQMPTPFSASSGSVKYAGQYGGGIDIMARIGVKGDKESSLCIMELKDENKESENFEHVFKQALAYATFIARLLREESCGRDYWNLFKPDSSAKLDNELDLYVVCLMPRNDSVRQFTEPLTISIEKLNVNFHLHSLYFEQSEDSKSIKEFSGTLPSIMR